MPPSSFITTGIATKTGSIDVNGVYEKPILFTTMLIPGKYENREKADILLYTKEIKHNTTHRAVLYVC